MPANETKSSWAWLRAAAPVAAAVGLVVALSLVLLERKHGVFSGGFLQAHPIQGSWAQLRFVAQVLLLEASLGAALLFLAWAVTARSTLSALQVAAAVGLAYLVLGAGAQVIRYEVLAYFGDMVSFGVLRNLGGGSLAGALLYAFDQYPAAFAGLLAVLATLTWGIWRLLRTRAVPRQARRSGAPQRMSAGVCLAWALAALLLLLAGALLAREQRTERRHIGKINAYALVHSLLLAGTPSGGTSHLLGALRGPAEAAPRAAPLRVQLGADKKHLVLVVAESVRGDVLDLKVGERHVAPTLRELAAGGSRGRHFFSHSGFTTSSLKAIFGAEEGAQRHLDGSLFEILKRQGYQVAVFSGQNEAFGEVEQAVRSRAQADLYFDARDAGSDRVFSSAAAGSLALSNERVVQEFERRSGRLDWQRPVFGYVNLQAAHYPYGHPGMPLTLIDRPIDRRALHAGNPELVRLAYLNAVAYTDASVARLVRHLKAIGQWERTLLVVCGDHGEALFENGVLGHGVRAERSQFNAVLVANQSVAGFEDMVGQRDLAPLLLRALGARFSGPWQPEAERSFVYVGALERPDQLAFFHRDGSEEVLDLLNSSFKPRRAAQALPIEGLDTGSPEHRQLSALIDYWRHAFRPATAEPPAATEHRRPKP